MARDHARLLVSVWTDMAWKSLTSAQQHVYCALISSPDLSYCGVLPYIPARFKGLSSDMTERRFTQAVQGLAAANFVVVDTATAEILVRSYVRHDGLLKQPNVTKALVKAVQRVHSETIRSSIEVELVRLLAEQPTAAGWKGFAALDQDGFANLHAKAFPNPSPNPSPNPKATPLPPSHFPLVGGTSGMHSSIRSVTREAAS